MTNEFGGQVPPEAATFRPDARETGKTWRPVEYEGCSASAAKGAEVDRAALLASKALIVDTGAYASFLEAYKDKETFTEEEIDALYRETIAAGIVDHHSIDQFLASKGIHPEKCASKIVADYPDAVKQLIDDHKIESVRTHWDSDEDAIVSSYLVKALIQNGELPAIAQELAEVTNRIDYGNFDITDPAEFIKTFSGIYGTIRNEVTIRFEEEKAEKGWSPALSAKYEDMRNAAVFDVINALNEHKLSGGQMDLGGDISLIIETLPPATRQLIEAGQPKYKESLEKFAHDFETALRFQTHVSTKDGGVMDVNLVVGSSEEPLAFMLMAYPRMAESTIVAVYAGTNDKHIDGYDVGIKPDMAKVIDLRELCLALNKAERKKRDAIMAKPETERTDKERELIATWEEQRASGRTRDMFTGIRDMVARGEVSADDIIDIDPTPLVAGDSLIPASRTSLLDKEEFQAVMREFAER